MTTKRPDPIQFGHNFIAIMAQMVRGGEIPEGVFVKIHHEDGCGIFKGLFCDCIPKIIGHEQACSECEDQDQCHEE